MESVLNGITEYSETERKKYRPAVPTTKHERGHVGVAGSQAGGGCRLACRSGGARPRDAAGPRRAAGPDERCAQPAPKQGATRGETKESRVEGGRPRGVGWRHSLAGGGGRRRRSAASGAAGRQVGRRKTELRRRVRGLRDERET